jgi:uncharacterized protein (TIGR02246 family)
MTNEPALIAEVTRLNRAFYEAFEAGDLEAMAFLWSHGEVTCVHPGWAPVAGRKAVMESWEAIFRGTEAITFQLRDVQVYLSGPTAWVILIEEIEAEQRDGEKIQAAALTTNVFIQEDESFRMIHHHASPVVLVQEEDDGDLDPAPKPLSELN